MIKTVGIHDFFCLNRYKFYYIALILILTFYRPFCPISFAAPLLQNTKTLEVKLRYKTLAEINVFSSDNEDEHSRYDSPLFKTLRNSHTINDFIVLPGAAIICGNFGADILKTSAYLNAGNEIIKFERAFKMLKKNGWFASSLTSIAYNGEFFFFGATSGDLIEVSEKNARLISIMSSAGRFRINKLKCCGEVLFLSTAGGGLYIYSKNRFLKLSERSHKFSSNDVNDVELFSFNSKKYLAIALSNGIALLKVNDLYKNDFENVFSFKNSAGYETVKYFDEKIYFGGPSGIDSIDMQSAMFVRKSVLKDTYISSINDSMAPDGGSKLYAAAYASGIYEFENNEKSFKKILSVPSLKISLDGDIAIRSMRRFGEDFFLLCKKGLFKFSNSLPIEIALNREGFSDKISAVCAHKGYLFCATFDCGVFAYDFNKTYDFSYFCTDRLSGPHVNAMAEFKGLLFIGTSNGLNVADIERKKIVPLKNELASQRINCLYASNNKVFAGTSDGISVISEDLSVKNIKLDATLIDRHVYSAYYDALSDTIYFGTYRGFGEINATNHTLKTYFMINSAISDNWVTLVTPYDESRLLIGTYDKGLCLFDKTLKKFTPFGSKKLMPSAMINSNAALLFGDYAAVGTYNGGAAIIKLKNSLTSKRFNTQNGLLSNMATSFAIYEHHLALGTFAGLAFIDLKDVESLFTQNDD